MENCCKQQQKVKKIPCQRTGKLCRIFLAKVPQVMVHSVLIAEAKDHNPYQKVVYFQFILLSILSGGSIQI